MTNETVTQNETQWLMDEGVPGSGERPEWFKPKYKTVAEQAKAYNEAIKLATNGGTGAPESYELGEFAEVIDPSDSSVQAFLDYAKSNHMTQETVMKAIEVAANTKRSMTVNEEKELERLGPDGARRREVIDQWVNNSMSAEGKEAFSKIPKTAEVLHLMDEMRQTQSRMRSATPSAIDHIATMAPLTEAQIRQEMQDNKDKYMSNPSYRAEISKKLSLVLGDS